MKARSHGIKVAIPFKLKNPKTRLSDLLSIEERKELAICMLSDVLESVIKTTDVGIVDVVEIVVPDRESLEACKKLMTDFPGDFSRGSDVRVVMDDRSLNDVVNSRIAEVSGLAVVMADLPLLTPEILKNFFRLEGDVVLSPGRKGGTNMLLTRSRSFEVSYHYGSFMKHVEIARSRGLRYAIFDSFYSSVDVDEEADILELLIHGKGKRSWGYLTSIGFGVSCEEKDPKVVRMDQSQLHR
jgi:2-phospho-L-lactate guanylyltransferase